MAKDKTRSDEFLVEDIEEETLSLLQPGLSPDELKKLVTGGDFEVEKFVPMVEGTRISGFFLGAGAPILMNDPNAERGSDGKRSVPSWRIKHPGGDVVMLIAGGAGLDSRIVNTVPGTFVIIQKGGKVELAGGRRTNQWDVLRSKTERIDVKKLTSPANGT